MANRRDKRCHRRRRQRLRGLKTSYSFQRRGQCCRTPGPTGAAPTTSDMYAERYRRVQCRPMVGCYLLASIAMLPSDLRTTSKRLDSRTRTKTAEGVVSFAVSEILTSSPSKPRTSSGQRYPADKRLPRVDRKSTRLNSSHLGISYAGFCLNKTTVEARSASFGWLPRDVRSAGCSGLLG